MWKRKKTLVKDLFRRTETPNDNDHDITKDAQVIDGSQEQRKGTHEPERKRKENQTLESKMI